MRTFILLVSVILVGAAGCTKPNPNRCCVNEADCAAAGLPVGMTCDDGRVCRANFCVAEVCNSSAACDQISPYCINPPDGVCQDRCTDDAQCPGNGQAAADRFCESGGCVQCRNAADCSASTPTCSNGACVACVENADCASGVCTDAGTCAAANEIAYVSVTGSPTAECTETAPCSTIERALVVTPTRTFVLLSPGTYTRSGALSILDRRFIIGRGTPRPAIDRTDNGPIITTQGPADVHLKRVDLSGATPVPGELGTNLDGYAIYCQNINGSPKVTLADVTITNNARGVKALRCTVDIAKSSFVNMLYGLEVTDSTVRIDRSVFENCIVNLDGGLFTVTNNIFARNSTGTMLYTEMAGTVIEFNTFVDNAFGCGAQVAMAFPSNIFARSANPGGPNCTFPGSIIAPTDISALKFKHPDSAPYDYHLLPGSTAIDAATASTLNHDFDGDARPKGAGRDVGADEAQ